MFVLKYTGLQLKENKSTQTEYTTAFRDIELSDSTVTTYTTAA
jgi:hypothetical protein